MYERAPPTWPPYTRYSTGGGSDPRWIPNHTGRGRAARWHPRRTASKADSPSARHGPSLPPQRCWLAGRAAATCQCAASKRRPRPPQGACAAGTSSAPRSPPPPQPTQARTQRGRLWGRRARARGWCASRTGRHPKEYRSLPAPGGAARCRCCSRRKRPVGGGGRGAP